MRILSQIEREQLGQALNAEGGGRGEQVQPPAIPKTRIQNKSSLNITHKDLPKAKKGHNTGTGFR